MHFFLALFFLWVTSVSNIGNATELSDQENWLFLGCYTSQQECFSSCPVKPMKAVLSDPNCSEALWYARVGCYCWAKTGELTHEQ